MDVLTLKALQYEAGHGYYEEERRDGNRFEVDLVFHADLRQAGNTDELEQTIDYQRAEQTVRRIMEGPSRKLIETLAHEIGKALFEEFPEARKLEVRLRKMDPPLPTSTQYSEVCMTWNR